MKISRYFSWSLFFLLIASFALAMPELAQAQTTTGGMAAITSTPAPGGGQNYSLSIQTLLFLTALTFIPAALTPIINCRLCRSSHAINIVH